MTLGWVNVLAHMNVRPNAQAYEHNHPKNIKKISQIMLLYKYKKRNNNFATMGLVGEFRTSPPPKKVDKSCNLVSSEVLLKLCFIESNLL